jgi:ribonucleoside-diphosphate reductase alpha chain
MLQTVPVSTLDVTRQSVEDVPTSEDAHSGPPPGIRNRLPDERSSITHKFRVGTHEGYLVVGLYPNGQPGKVFITMAKEGSTISGLINSVAQAVSIGL